MGYADARPEQGASIDDRDRRLESRYTYDRCGEQTTLAFVAVYADELTRAFLDWFVDEHMHLEEPESGLGRWEVVRFGTSLDRAPHQALWCVVRRTMRGEKPKRSVKLTPGLESVERHQRFIAAVDALVRERGM